MDVIMKKIHDDGKMNGKQLIALILLSSSFAEMVEGFEESKHDNIYESTWSLIFKLGLHAMFPYKDFEHYMGCVNDGKQKLIQNIQHYIDELVVFDNNESENARIERDLTASGITMQNKNSKKWVFIASNYFLDDASPTHSVRNYGMVDIISVSMYMQYEYDMYLTVNDKTKVKNRDDVRDKKNTYMTKYINDIFDLNDLEKIFKNLKDEISKKMDKKKMDKKKMEKKKMEKKNSKRK